MKQALYFSVGMSLLSLVLVLFTPLKVHIRESSNLYSPYKAELDQWESRWENGLKPHEVSQYEALVEKNNHWFAEEKHEYLQFSANSALSAWRKKSSYIAPGIMIVWGLAFYYYFRNKQKRKAIYVLTFPTLLTLVGLMSLLEGILISSVVLLIWFGWLIKGRIS